MQQNADLAPSAVLSSAVEAHGRSYRKNTMKGMWGSLEAAVRRRLWTWNKLPAGGQRSASASSCSFTKTASLLRRRCSGLESSSFQKLVSESKNGIHLTFHTNLEDVQTQSELSAWNEEGRLLFGPCRETKILSAESLKLTFKTSLETGEKEAEIWQNVSYQQKYCVKSKFSDFLGGFLFFFAARTDPAFPFS